MGMIDRIRELFFHLMEGDDADAPTPVRMGNDLFHAFAGFVFGLSLILGVLYAAIGLWKQRNDGGRDSLIDARMIAFPTLIGAALSGAALVFCPFGWLVPLAASAVAVGTTILSAWYRRK